MMNEWFTADYKEGIDGILFFLKSDCLHRRKKDANREHQVVFVVVVVVVVMTLMRVFPSTTNKQRVVTTPMTPIGRPTLWWEHNRLRRRLNQSSSSSSSSSPSTSQSNLTSIRRFPCRVYTCWNFKKLALVRAWFTPCGWNETTLLYRNASAPSSRNGKKRRRKKKV